MPHEVLNGRVDPLYNLDNYVKETKLKLQTIYNETSKLIDKMKEKNKRHYDKKTNTTDYKIGDIVKIYNEPYDKFKFIFDGPFEISKVSDKNVEIILGNGKKYVTHKNRICKF